MVKKTKQYYRVFIQTKDKRGWDKWTGIATSTSKKRAHDEGVKFVKHSNRPAHFKVRPSKLRSDRMV